MSKLAGSLKSFSEWLTKGEQALGIIAGILLIVMMMLTIIDTSGRDLFNKPLQGSVEYSEILLAAIVGIGIAVAQGKNEHIGMELIPERLKGIKNLPLYPLFQIFCITLAEAFMIFALYYFFRGTLDSIGMKETSMGPIYVTLWPVKAVMCLGLLFLCIRLAIEAINNFKLIPEWKSK